MPFWIVETHNAALKSWGVGHERVCGVGEGPKGPWRGWMFEGERMMFSLVLLASALEVDGWEVSGIGEFMAMCDTPIALAKWIHRGARLGDVAGCTERRAFQDGEENALCGRRRRGG
jgi:hypothetical protein